MNAEHTAAGGPPTEGRARSSRILLIVAVLLLVGVESVVLARAMHGATGGRWVLPIDDAYIHQQYAVQAARGRPFQYNDQAPPTSGATSLLYPFILATAWRVGFRGDSLSFFAFAFGGVCLVASVLMAARVSRELYARLTPTRHIPQAWVGVLTAALLLANGALLWSAFSGMEGALFVLLLLTTLDGFVSRNGRQAVLAGGLLALTRPEGLTASGILLLIAAAGAWRNAKDRQAWTWLYVIPPALGLVHPLLNLALTGSASPNGMRAKSWLYNVPFYLGPILRSMGSTAAEVWSVFLTGVELQQLSDLRGYLTPSPDRVLLTMPPLLGGLGLLYLLRCTLREWRCRRMGAGALLTLWILTGLGAAAVMGTALWHFYRYLIPWFVLGLLTGAVALAPLASRLGNARGARTLFAAVGLLAVLFSAASLPGWSWRFGEACKTTLSQQVRMGEWIRDNCPPGARIGVHDVGAVRYYGGRDTYDLVGLTEPPEVGLAWRQGSGSIFEAMERCPRPPDYMAIYDDVYALPYLAGTDLFSRELLRVEHIDLPNVAAASDHQVVYAADWRLRNSGDHLWQQDVRDGVQNLRLVDSLDVADLDDEGQHGYHWWQAKRKAGFCSDLFQLTYWLPPHQEVLDGGRLITGGESFYVDTLPGQPLLLVGRFLGQGPVALTVSVDGQEVGPWGYGALPGHWQERAFKVPAEYVTRSRTRVELAVDARRPDLEFHRPFYYWCYQGELPDEPPQIANRLEAQVGEEVTLLGYSLELIPGDADCELSLDLYWQALGPVAADYKVFVHAADDGEAILAQQDSRPGRELQPTWLWTPGEIVSDHYDLTLPLDAVPAAGVRLLVGMYEPASGERLPIVGGDAARRLELERIALPDAVSQDAGALVE